MRNKPRLRDTMSDCQYSGPTLVVVTGFDKFGDILDNPSKRIVETLRDDKLWQASLISEVADAAHRHSEDNDSTSSSVGKTQVIEFAFEILEVSVECCKDFHSRVLSAHPTADPRRIHFLHVGVNYRGLSVELELQAFNNMTFRLPDEAGFMPQQQRIEDRVDWDKPRSSPYGAEMLQVRGFPPLST